MLYVSIPTREEFLRLTEMRSDICVSIYLKTTPLPQDILASRIELDNQVKKVFAQLQESGADKKRLEALENEIFWLLNDDDFWAFHANSLVILASPDFIRTYRMANEIETQIEISDRFFLKPLLRALTFPQTAYILALSENEVRLVEFFTSGHPEIISLPDMPKDALSAVGKSSLTASLHSMSHENGSRGKTLRQGKYIRKIDEALRPLLLHSDVPLILVSTEPLASLFRSTFSLPNLVEGTVSVSPDRIGLTELVASARPLLDAHYARELKSIKELFEERQGQDRVATDLADIAKAATYGMVSLLLVDFDALVKGSIDEAGTLSFSDNPDAYGVIDEIVKRSLACGAKVMAVRKDDMIGGTGAAAILRYSL